MPSPRSTPRPNGNPAPPIDPATARLLDELDRIALETFLAKPAAGTTEPVPPLPSAPLRTGSLTILQFASVAACGALALLCALHCTLATGGMLVVGLAFTLLDLVCHDDGEGE
jgi:hypothetical protein